MTEFSILPLKRVSHFQTGCTPPGRGDEYFEDGGVPWVRPGDLSGALSIRRASASLSQDGIRTVRLVPPGSSLLCCIGSIGNIGFAEVALATNQQITAIVPDSSLINPRFLLYCTISSKQALDAAASANVVKIINNSELGRLPVPVPPLPTQKAIANFLDRKTAAIDALIEKKQKLLELLKEKRAALINQAVTKGLDPNVPMKDSGIPWIGEIPAHWGLKRLKLGLRLIDGDRGPNYPTSVEFVSAGVPFLSSKNIRDGFLDLGEVNLISAQKLATLRKGQLQRGDIVITVRGSIGNAAIFEAKKFETGFINAQMMIGRPDQRLLNSEWLWLLTQSNLWSTQMSYLAYGTAQQQLSNEILGNVVGVFPPLAEQKELLSQLLTELKEFVDVIDKNQLVIEKLQEYRQALITAAVTGQIDIPAEEESEA